MKKDTLNLIGYLLVIAFILFCMYAAIATKIFQFRHPKANSMIFWHEPKAVLTLGTVKEYK